ncbi:hypothetical protein BN1723_018071, partial [Verticillium longisporum]
RRGPHPAH